MGSGCSIIWVKNFVWYVSESNCHFDYSRCVTLTSVGGFMAAIGNGTSKLAGGLRAHILAL